MAARTKRMAQRIAPTKPKKNTRCGNPRARPPAALHQNHPRATGPCLPAEIQDPSTPCSWAYSLRALPASSALLASTLAHEFVHVSRSLRLRRLSSSCLAHFSQQGKEAEYTPLDRALIRKTNASCAQQRQPAQPPPLRARARCAPFCWPAAWSKRQLSLPSWQGP